MPRVFVSYRRADSLAIVDRLVERLVRAFGQKSIFRDVSSIPYGSDFRGVIVEAIAASDVVLVVIGRNWLTITDDTGARRLDKPDDPVRVEVEIAIQRDRVTLIPLLVDGAGMPKADDLPVSLRELAFKNALPIRHDPDFNDDVATLIRRIKPPTDWRIIAAALVLLLVGVTAALNLSGVVRFFPTATPTTTATAAPTATDTSSPTLTLTAAATASATPTPAVTQALWQIGDVFYVARPEGVSLLNQPDAAAIPVSLSPLAQDARLIILGGVSYDSQTGDWWWQVATFDGQLVGWVRQAALSERPTRPTPTTTPAPVIQPQVPRPTQRPLIQPTTPPTSEPAAADEPLCPNSICDPGETVDTCYIDCYVPLPDPVEEGGADCGNSICEPGEETTCAIDC